ncbi:hypothetical protein ACOSQ3_031124 [Xanthoceras sorbifolium]
MWDRVSPSSFVFDPLTVRTCAGGVIGFAVLIIFARSSGFWLCSRSLPVVTGSNRGSKDQVCGALSGFCEEDPVSFLWIEAGQFFFGSAQLSLLLVAWACPILGTGAVFRRCGCLCCDSLAFKRDLRVAVLHLQFWCS